MPTALNITFETVNRREALLTRPYHLYFLFNIYFVVVVVKKKK